MKSALTRKGKKGKYKLAFSLSFKLVKENNWTDEMLNLDEIFKCMNLPGNGLSMNQ